QKPARKKHWAPNLSPLPAPPRPPGREPPQHPCRAGEETRLDLARRCSKAGSSCLRTSGKIGGKTIGRPWTGERRVQAGNRFPAIDRCEPRAEIHERSRREEEGPIQYHLGVESRHHRY